jgi:hypothetical protein
MVCIKPFIPVILSDTSRLRSGSEVESKDPEGFFRTQEQFDAFRNVRMPERVARLGLDG